MSHDLTVHALIPDHLGITVVDVEQLVSYLTAGQSLEEAITNSGMDQVQTDELAEAVGRVRDLNASGDAGAYWDRDEPS